MAMVTEEQAKAVAAEAKAEVVKVAEEVKAEAEKAVTAVKAEAEKTVTEISAEEKLALSQLENQFLKAQMEMTRLQNVIQDIQKRFPAQVDSLVKKYMLNPVEWIFDSGRLAFVRKPQPPKQ
jgi:uncharacterized protein YqfB (UPF0267 family)